MVRNTRTGNSRNNDKHNQRGLQQVTDVALRCRSMGHAWDDIDPGWVFRVVSRDSRGRVKTVSRSFTCMRCEAGVIRVLDARTFNPVGNPRRIYPEGYLLHGVGRTWRHDANAELYRRRLREDTVRTYGG